MYANEMMVNIAGGPGGLLILTNLRGIFFPTGTENVVHITLDEIRISYRQIKRIEVSRVPIFYLENDTAIAYGQVD